MKRLAIFLLPAALLAGCNTESKTHDLQQEKLALDLMQAQQSQLADLLKREQADEALNKKNQADFADIEQQQTAIENQRRDTAAKQKAAEASIAAEKSALSIEKKRLDEQSKSLDARDKQQHQADQELAAKRQSLLALRHSIESPRHGEQDIATQDAQFRAQQMRQQEEADARAKTRQPALEALATATERLFATPEERAAAYNELLVLFRRSDIARVKDDDIFVMLARGLAESYYFSKGNYPALEVEKQTFEAWGEQYLKNGAK